MKYLYLLTAVLLLTALACQMQLSTPAPVPSAEILPTETPIKSPTVENLPTEASQRTAVVKQVLVNVRDEPDGAVIGSLKSGDRVTIVRCVGDWCKIQEPAGWVFAGCLTIETALGCSAK